MPQNSACINLITWFLYYVAWFWLDIDLGWDYNEGKLMIQKKPRYKHSISNVLLVAMASVKVKQLNIIPYCHMRLLDALLHIYMKALRIRTVNKSPFSRLDHAIHIGKNIFPSKYSKSKVIWQFKTISLWWKNGWA